MAGKDNCTTAAHGGTMFDDRQPIQETFGESVAEKAVAAVHNSCTPGASRAELCAWMPGLRTKLSPDSDLIRTATGKNGWYLKRKEGDHTGKRRRCRVSRGQNTPILHTARLVWAASVGKTAGKRRRRVYGYLDLYPGAAEGKTAHSVY